MRNSRRYIFLWPFVAPLLTALSTFLGSDLGRNGRKGVGVTNIEQFFVLKKSQPPGRLVFFCLDMKPNITNWNCSQEIFPCTKFSKFARVISSKLQKLIKTRWFVVVDFFCCLKYLDILIVESRLVSMKFLSQNIFMSIFLWESFYPREFLAFVRKHQIFQNGVVFRRRFPPSHQEPWQSCDFNLRTMHRSWIESYENPRAYVQWFLHVKKASTCDKSP